MREALVPRLILQPLVENAIRHGVTRRITPGQVEVRAWERAGRLHLTVRDDGVGLGAQVREGLGLSITRARLRQLYGREQRFALSPAPAGGAVCTLSLPAAAGAGGLVVTDARIRALIVDDEPLARARLRGLLAKHADMQLVGECAEGGEAIATIDRMQPEVVFLDIQMTETSGLDVATSLDGRARPAVVFVTAHERYALEAFEVRALDYLLKPFEEARFAATLERVRAYASAVRAQRSHEHLVAILRELSYTPRSELERLRAPAMPLRFADLEVDTATREVRRAGAPVALRPKEYDLLVALMRRRRGGGDAPGAAGRSVGIQRRREQPDGGHPRRGPAAEARLRRGRAGLHRQRGEGGIPDAGVTPAGGRVTIPSTP